MAECISSVPAWLSFRRLFPKPCLLGFFFSSWLDGGELADLCKSMKRWHGEMAPDKFHIPQNIPHMPSLRSKSWIQHPKANPYGLDLYVTPQKMDKKPLPHFTNICHLPHSGLSVHLQSAHSSPLARREALDKSEKDLSRTGELYQSLSSSLVKIHTDFTSTAKEKEEKSLL